MSLTFLQSLSGQSPMYQNSNYALSSVASVLWHGTGHCAGHFGELIQGVFRFDGKAIRGLVTIPCRKIGTECRITVSQEGSEIRVPSKKAKVNNAIRAYLDLHGISNEFTITADINSSIPVGIGMGSSTADIVATIRALDQALGCITTPNDIAAITLKSELACDPTMYSRTVKLFAQRKGQVLEDFGRPFMPFCIWGFNLMPDEIFSTDDTPPAKYSEAEEEKFTNLLGELRQAMRSQDLAGLAHIATESAVINQRHFPKRGFSELLDLQVATRALGVCVSHSGTIAGLMFPAGTPQSLEIARRVDASAKACNFVPLGIFRV